MHKIWTTLGGWATTEKHIGFQSCQPWTGFCFSGHGVTETRQLKIEKQCLVFFKSKLRSFILFLVADSTALDIQTVPTNSLLHRCTTHQMSCSQWDKLKLWMTQKADSTGIICLHKHSRVHPWQWVLNKLWGSHPMIWPRCLNIISKLCINSFTEGRTFSGTTSKPAAE